MASYAGQAHFSCRDESANYSRGIAYLVAARAIESTMQPSLEHQSVIESMWVQMISLEMNFSVNQTAEGDPPLR